MLRYRAEGNLAKPKRGPLRPPIKFYMAMTTNLDALQISHSHALYFKDIVPHRVFFKSLVQFFHLQFRKEGNSANQGPL